MEQDTDDVLSRIKTRDIRTIAKLITQAESLSPEVRPILATLAKEAGDSHVIGVTGAPGVGKSSLVDHLALYWHQKGKRVAVLAVDPSSPFSGGAVLGDRIRMNNALQEKDIFIRSLASRGSSGGLSRATFDAIQILEAAGFDLILIETVGVGQVEVDIMRMADTCLVLLVPGLGDSVQAMKAGILEIADIFVINKADLPGVDLVRKDLMLLLSLTEADERWKPEIIDTVATKGQGIDPLSTSIKKHLAWLNSSSEGEARKRRVIRERILQLSRELLAERLNALPAAIVEEGVDACLKEQKDPYQIANKLLNSLN